jgi:hypothetical protein
MGNKDMLFRHVGFLTDELGFLFDYITVLLLMIDWDKWW